MSVQTALRSLSSAIQSNPREPMFDAARRVDPDGILTNEDVAKIDAALDAAGVARPVPDEPDSDNHLTTSPDGISLMHRFEGCARKRPDGLYEAYPDPGTGGKPWTIGWGNTTDSSGNPIKPGTVWTKGQCDARFGESLRDEYEHDVVLAIGDAPTSQAQFDAMVSFHYNTGAIQRSTLLKKHVAGDYVGAEREFHRWNRAGGRVLNGLVRRRAAEARLYRSGS